MMSGTESAKTVTQSDSRPPNKNNEDNYLEMSY